MNKSSNTCIITFYDQSFRIFGRLAWKSIKRYAEIHKYDAICFNERLTDRPVPWEKILCIQKAFEMGYEFVFWIDADAVIVDVSEDIRSVIKPGRDIFLVRHFIDGGYSPNTGVLLIRNTDKTKQILHDIWSMNNYINHIWWEQGAFIDYFGLVQDLSQKEQEFFEGFQPHPKPHPSEPVESVVDWISSRWNVIPHVNPEAKPIIKHYAGLSKNKILRLHGMISDTLHGGHLSIKDFFSYIYYRLLLVVTGMLVWAARIKRSFHISQ